MTDEYVDESDGSVEGTDDDCLINCCRVVGRRIGG